MKNSALLTLPILSFLFFQGCSTTTKVVGVTTSPEKTITLSYSTSQFDDSAFRSDAKNKADQFCKKPAILISENLKNEGPSPAWGYLVKDEGTYLTFKCD